MSFCPNGFSDNFTLNSSGSSYTVDISSVDLETGAVRITSSAGNAVYFAFGPAATVSDIVVSSGSEIFKVPSGATEITFLSSTASLIKLFVNIGQIT